jgi:hypothetical protein
MQYADEQGLALARIRHQISSAEKRLFTKRLGEKSILRSAMDSQAFEYWRLPDNKAKKALAIARAARDTLLAEERLANVRVIEAKLQLRSSKEAAEAARSKVNMADQQVGRLMNEIDSQGYPPSSSNNAADDFCDAGPHEPQPATPSDFDSDCVSEISGLESYFTA